MTFVFLVLFLTAQGVTGETSRPYPDYVSCERARGQVIMAYANGDRPSPPNVRVVTMECMRK